MYRALFVMQPLAVIDRTPLCQHMVSGMLRQWLATAGGQRHATAGGDALAAAGSGASAGLYGGWWWTADGRRQRLGGWISPSSASPEIVSSTWGTKISSNFVKKWLGAK